MASRAGLVVRAPSGLHFIPAKLARSLVAAPEVSLVPGAALGMAMVSGEVVAVLPLGSAGSALVVCDVDGELVGFSGLVPEASGFFEEAEGGVLFADEHVSDLDLAAALQRIEHALVEARRRFSHGSD
jgi:hypothetical protein